MDQQDILRDQLRQYLNQNKIKLWLQPYSQLDGSKGFIPIELIDGIQNQFQIESSLIHILLEDLRIHSVEKLGAQIKFNETGIAQLKVKIAGCPPDLIPLVDLSTEFNIEINLNKTGLELIKEISKMTGIPGNFFKFIANGKALNEQIQLSSQQIKNFSQILGICLSKCEKDILLENDKKTKVNKIKEATKYLIESNNNNNSFDDHYQLQIADQNGQPLQIPKDEQQALTIAMLMHEKGRAALKKKNYGLALTYLTEANSEFNKCSSSILELVDNFALVCLDLVWCYFCLQNVTYLPDAKLKLQIAENMFNRSYGKNMERVSSLKGNCEQERALFLRLHILQAVIAFHNAQYSFAKQLLNQAQQDLDKLKVDETKLMQIVEMGFELVESRLALRYTSGDVARAVERITRLRRERDQLEAKIEAEKMAKKLEDVLGVTAGSGTPIDASLYVNLKSMGFDRRLVARALLTSENDMFAALRFIHENSDVDLDGLFDPEQQVPTTSTTTHETQPVVHDDVESQSTVSSTSNDVNTAELNETIKDEIIGDINNEVNDYLDLDLDEEATIIQEYHALILSQQY